jgi:ribosomal protein S18 acetylase RimI-like enzyme
MDVAALRQRAAGVGVTVRALRPGDRAAAGEALVACGAFTDEEVRVALEVLDAGVEGGLDGDYPLFAAEADGRFAGYVCVGRTPLTHSTWHLYWICVRPEAQGRGVGRALQAHAEAFVRSRGGERIVLETSATAAYARACAFYAAAGYAIVGRIPDFYRPGDDCLVYCRAWPAASATS